MTVWRPRALRYDSAVWRTRALRRDHALQCGRALCSDQPRLGHKSCTEQVLHLHRQPRVRTPVGVDPVHGLYKVVNVLELLLLEYYLPLFNLQLVQI